MSAMSSTLLGLQDTRRVGGEIVVRALLGSGRCELRMSPMLARALTGALAAELGEAPRSPEPPGEERRHYTNSRRDGRRLKPEVRATYVRAWAEAKSGRWRSLAEACRQYGLNYMAAQRWLRDHVAGLAAEAAALPQEAGT